jgi:hypothetical protein
MSKLRLQQQEREYNKMVSSVVTSEDQKFNLGIKPDELKEVKSHIATIFNIAFSMVAVYVAVYKASKTIVNDIGIVSFLLVIVGKEETNVIFLAASVDGIRRGYYDWIG